LFLAGGARQQRQSANGALGGEGAHGRSHGARLESRTPLRQTGDAGADPTGGLGGGEEEVLTRQRGDVDGGEGEREEGPKKKKKKKKKTRKSTAAE
jgi:hypothetical protein